MPHIAAVAPLLRAAAAARCTSVCESLGEKVTQTCEISRNDSDYVGSLSFQFVLTLFKDSIQAAQGSVALESVNKVRIPRKLVINQVRTCYVAPCCPVLPDGCSIQ